jgi:two-component system, LytTR family, response regulator
MKIIIIEDEKPAAEKLRKSILQFDQATEFPGILHNVHAAVEWLTAHPAPDLIFMDIELSDGLSFKIFESCQVSCPIIFTTAYDEYWQEALEYNGIDYLLKPIKMEKLVSALTKYLRLQQHFSFNYKDLFQQLPMEGRINGFRKRFLVKKGTDLVAVKTNDIAFCYAAHKLAFVVDEKGQKFILDRSLNDLEKELDPALFFRANRKFLVNIQYISRIKTFPKSKLLVELMPPAPEEIMISQESAPAFKQWMGG